MRLDVAHASAVALVAKSAQNATPPALAKGDDPGGVVNRHPPGEVG